MPRNGDGSSNNGPIEGENLIHGASGDATLKHVQNHVAPAPEGEKGAALEGLPASGGGATGSHQHDSHKPAAVDQATKS